MGKKGKAKHEAGSNIVSAHNKNVSSERAASLLASSNAAADVTSHTALLSLLSDDAGTISAGSSDTKRIDSQFASDYYPLPYSSVATNLKRQLMNTKIAKVIELAQDEQMALGETCAEIIHHGMRYVLKLANNAPAVEYHVLTQALEVCRSLLSSTTSFDVRRRLLRLLLLREHLPKSDKTTVPFVDIVLIAAPTSKVPQTLVTALVDTWLTICRLVASKELAKDRKLPSTRETHFSEQLDIFVEALAWLAFERFTEIGSSQTTLSNRANILLGIVVVLRAKFPSAHLERLQCVEPPYRVVLVKELAQQEQLKHARVYANDQLLRQWFELLEQIGLCKAVELVDELITAVKANKSIVCLDAQSATDAAKLLMSLRCERANSAELLVHQELSKCKRTPCDGMPAILGEELNNIKETFTSLENYAQVLQSELRACSTVLGGDEITAIANAFYRLAEVANRCEEKCPPRMSELAEEVLNRGVISQSSLRLMCLTTKCSDDMSSACIQRAIHVALAAVDLACTDGNELLSPHHPLTRLAGKCALELVDTLQSRDFSLDACLSSTTDACESLLIERTVRDEQYRALVSVSYRMSRQPLEILIDAIDCLANTEANQSTETSKSIRVRGELLHALIQHLCIADSDKCMPHSQRLFSVIVQCALTDPSEVTSVLRDECQDTYYARLLTAIAQSDVSLTETLSPQDAFTLIKRSQYASDYINALEKRTGVPCRVHLLLHARYLLDVDDAAKLREDDEYAPWRAQKALSTDDTAIESLKDAVKRPIRAICMLQLSMLTLRIEVLEALLKGEEQQSEFSVDSVLRELRASVADFSRLQQNHIGEALVNELHTRIWHMQYCWLPFTSLPQPKEELERLRIALVHAYPTVSTCNDQSATAMRIVHWAQSDIADELELHDLNQLSADLLLKMGDTTTSLRLVRLIYRLESEQLWELLRKEDDAAAYVSSLFSAIEDAVDVIVKHPSASSRELAIVIALLSIVRRQQQMLRGIDGAAEVQALFDTFGQIHVLPACTRIVRRMHERWAKGIVPEREKIEYALEHQLLYEAFSTLRRYPEQIISHYYAAKEDIDGAQHFLDPDMTEQGYSKELQDILTSLRDVMLPKVRRYQEVHVAQYLRAWWLLILPQIVACDKAYIEAVGADDENLKRTDNAWNDIVNLHCRWLEFGITDTQSVYISLLCMRMLLDRLTVEEPNNIRQIQLLIARYEWLHERVVTYTDALAQKTKELNIDDIFNGDGALVQPYCDRPHAVLNDAMTTVDYEQRWRRITQLSPPFDSTVELQLLCNVYGSLLNYMRPLLRRDYMSRTKQVANFLAQTGISKRFAEREVLALQQYAKNKDSRLKIDHTPSDEGTLVRIIFRRMNQNGDMVEDSIQIALPKTGYPLAHATLRPAARARPDQNSIVMMSMLTNPSATSSLIDVARTFRSCCLRRDEAPGADDVCIICLESNFASRPVGARRVKCQQCSVVYHRNCLHTWFVSNSKTNCPHCQKSFGSVV